MKTLEQVNVSCKRSSKNTNMTSLVFAYEFVNQFVLQTFGLFCLHWHKVPRHVTSSLWRGLWRKLVWTNRTKKCRSTKWLINLMLWCLYFSLFTIVFNVDFLQIFACCRGIFRMLSNICAGGFGQKSWPFLQKAPS